MNKKLKLGIIGIGAIGTWHVTYITEGKCPEVELTAVADIDPARLIWAKEKTPEVVCFKTAEEMLDSGIIDAVLVAVPHYDHPRLAIECFKRGLHVLIEKPSGVYAKQAREMNEAADKANVAFGIMYNQRTDHIYRQMREIVKSGEMGIIKRVNWLITDWYRPQSYYDSGAWRAKWKTEGGGVLLNQCPHNLDLLQWICGMPTLVDAKLHFGKWHKIEVEDDVTAYLEFENGATGAFITTTGDFPGSNRFEISLDGGKLVAENGRLMMWKSNQFESEFSKAYKEQHGSPKAEEILVETDGKSEQHAGVVNAFASAVLRGEKLIADGREGINGLTISNAMHLSAWTNSPVVLPFDEELYYNELAKRAKF